MMPTLFILSFIVFILSIHSPVAHSWTKADGLWQSAYLTIHVVDWGQTLDIATRCENGELRESNVVLGGCPDVKKVNAYFLSTAIAHTTLAYWMPQKYRRMFQLGTLSLQLNAVNKNRQLGLKISF